ncbi:MAG TPA: FKBP-type peptidyl-prolyl cis-trans isomerase [Longimicrobiaceae bacterium]|nr:FKBP-type peptidyl-prolyl cis-trans isomerase [Longimicrobiaceae bacterium]
MKFRALLAAGAMVTSLSACLEGSTGPECDDINPQVTGTKGDTTTLASGLRYVQTQAQVGSGATARSCRGVAVHYTGMLTSGTNFGTSRGGAPVQFTPGLGELIPGFEEGVVGMRVGGQRRLIVPPSLAYGSQARTDQAGNVVIPANSTLIFDIELVAVQQ